MLQENAVTAMKAELAALQAAPPAPSMHAAVRQAWRMLDLSRRISAAEDGREYQEGKKVKRDEASGCA